MSLDKIQQLVGSLTKSISDNERIATPILAAKLAKAIKSYPSDQTIGAMLRVIDKMASNNTAFIRKAELKDLYKKLYSRNTKFAELFQDELNIVQHEQSAPTSNRDDSVNDLNPYEVADPVLVNALNSVFDKCAPVKLYSEKLANKALSSVVSILDNWNLKPNALSVNSGNEKFLVIKADYETPKGITSFYVPVETRNNKIIEASIFMGNTGPQELNHSTIKTYLTSFAGNKLQVNANSILDVLTSAASEDSEISGAEIALVKLNATRQGNSEFFANQIVGQKVAEASVQDVELPKYDEFVSFEKQFTSSYGQAAWQFGADKIKIARDNIVRELASYGHKNLQVVVAKNTDNTVFYNVALDAGKVGFTVPVKIADGKISKPGIILCNGSVASFSKEDINQLYINNQTDFKAAASASPLFDLKPSDLIDNIRSAVEEGNSAKAEDALNVLASAGNETAYATGFQIFMQSLANKANATPKTECSHTIKNASSEHPICVHTGLPAHKVYQDKDGNCRPLYRRGMEETYDGAIFNNSKIFG